MVALIKKLKPQGATFGDSHYWLEDAEGRILDLIFRDRKRLARGIAYKRGKGGSVLKDRSNKAMPAHKHTQRIIRVVEAALNP